MRKALARDLAHASLDASQRRAFDALDRVMLHRHHGAYIHGGVGRGKTMLMNAFARASREMANDDERSTIARVHFHAFMTNVHARLHARRDARESDGCEAVGAALARETKTLCLDEIEISDVADAMVFKRVMETYLGFPGRVLVGTSNFPPDGLYRGGINRSAFAPFVDEVRRRCEIVDVSADGGGVDYRRAGRMHGDGNADAAASRTIVFASHGAQQDDSRRRAALTEAWDEFARRGGDASTSAASSTSLSITLDGGRLINAKARVGDHAVWFSFATVCGGNFGPIDYLNIANRFRVVCVEDIPSLPVFSAENEARRFINLIDLLYEHNVVLLASFLSATSPDEVFADAGAGAGVASASAELSTRQRTALESNPEIFVTAKGGSSGRSTTMMSPTTEWSATGRVGASLRDAQAENFTLKAAPRAVSRLAHMSSESYSTRARARAFPSRANPYY